MRDTIDNNILIELGSRIKQLRSDKNMTQVGLAIGCNMQKATLSKIEKGQVNVSIITIHRLSKCLGVPIDKITG